jgi:hypothetical protein
MAAATVVLLDKSSLLDKVCSRRFGAWQWMGCQSLSGGVVPVSLQLRVLRFAPS